MEAMITQAQERVAATGSSMVISAAGEGAEFVLE
jgi:hypothetical protein